MSYGGEIVHVQFLGNYEKKILWAAHMETVSKFIIKGNYHLHETIYYVIEIGLLQFVNIIYRPACPGIRLLPP